MISLKILIPLYLKYSPSSLLLGRKYGQIREQLHTSLPETMLCREKESLVVNKFLEKNLREETCRSLYISGAPGTGKTVCLTKELQKMRVRIAV